MNDADVTGAVRHEDPKVGQWERYTEGYRVGQADRAAGRESQVLSVRTHNDPAWATGYVDSYSLLPVSAVG